MMRVYATAGRWVRHRTGPGDRGDNPVPSAVIIAGLAVIALILVGLVLAAVNDFWAQVPSGGDLPDLPSD